ncbi:MAG: hypothetical protein WCK49_10430 [Myxococcaceae bacterium]
MKTGCFALIFLTCFSVKADGNNTSDGCVPILGDVVSIIYDLNDNVKKIIAKSSDYEKLAEGFLALIETRTTNVAVANYAAIAGSVTGAAFGLSSVLVGYPLFVFMRFSMNKLAKCICRKTHIEIK